MASPLVTVFSMCYNQAHFVIESLESIRNQTYDNIQLVISDDCSSDNSVETIQAWIDQHDIDCVFVAHEKNQGITRTLNELLTYATGQYICMLAADDLWMPAKIEKQVELLENSPPHVGIVYSDSYQFDEDGNPLEDMYIETHRKFDIPPSGDVFIAIAGGNFLAAQSTLIRKSVYDTIGIYDERLVYEDWDFWLRAAQKFHFKFSDYISCKYRIVSTSITKTHLHARSEIAEVSDFLLYEKCVKSKRLNSELEQAFRARMSGLAKRLYWSGFRNSTRMLFVANRYNPTFITLAMLLKSLVRKPGKKSGLDV